MPKQSTHEITWGRTGFSYAKNGAVHELRLGLLVLKLVPQALISDMQAAAARIERHRFLKANPGARPRDARGRVVKWD